MRNILCNIGDEIVLNLGGKSEVIHLEELRNPEKLSKIYQIQFSKEPQKKYFNFIVNLLKDNTEIDLRFYGNYLENTIDWESLKFIEKLQIDLSETKDLKDLIYLKNLKQLGITKNVKSTVSLKVIANLDKLEYLFTSISKDIQTVENLKNLKFLSLREIKTKNIDFIANLENLNSVSLSLGSYGNIDGITSLKNLEKLAIHQIRNFSDEQLNSILSKCTDLKALELQNLKGLENLYFLKELKKLQYLFLEGNKNLASYQSVENLKNLKTFSTSNSRAKDRKLDYLQNIDYVFLGDRYPKNLIENFSKNFKGKNLWIYGKEIKGKLEKINPLRV